MSADYEYLRKAPMPALITSALLISKSYPSTHTTAPLVGASLIYMYHIRIPPRIHRCISASSHPRITYFRLT